jgi:hypothetical protein
VIRALIVLAVIVVVALVAGLVAELTAADPEHAKPDRLERPSGGRFPGPPAPPALSGADPSATGELVAVVTYLDALEQERLERERQAVAAYLDAIEQTRLADAAAAAARMAQARPTPGPPATSGGASGPHSDAWWWGVAVCEQGGRNDPYFGYFSWMDGSAAGMTWDQQVAKSNDLLRRAGREVGPWAASCVAAGYRASPGG